MNNNYYEEIESIRSNLNNLNSKLDFENPTINIVPEEKNKVIVEGSRYILEQHLWKQQSINYKKDLRKYVDGKPIDYNITDQTTLDKIISENDYKKPWGRLDKYQRKVKTREYIDFLVDTGLIDTYSKKDLILSIYKLINENKLCKNNQILYDKELCKIDKIYCLDIVNKTYTIKQ